MRGERDERGGLTLKMSRLLPIAFVLALAQTGCIVVGGYRSGGGWFVWPGGLGLLLIVVVVLLLARRRR
jgi:hypothetical protein